MAISIDDIIKKEFARSLMGYDMQEVDVFLDAIIDRIEHMEQEREELVAAMEKLLKRVERLEKSGEVERRAVENGEKTSRRLSAPAAAGPVRVQGGKATADAAEERPVRKEKASQPNRKHAGAAIQTDAPAHSKPIRPPAQPFTPPAPAVAAAQPEAVQSAYAINAQQAAEVAIEMETGLPAQDGGEILPELIQDIENALLDGSIRSASHKETPVRAADKSRVS